LVTLFFILILFSIETSGLYLFKNIYFHSYKPPIFHHFIGYLSTCSNLQSCNNRTIHSTLCYSCIQDILIKDQIIQRGSSLNFPRKCYYVPSPHLYFYLKAKNVILNVAMCIFIDISVKCTSQCASYSYSYNNANEMHKFSNLFLEYNSTCFRQVFCPKHVEFYSKNKFEKFLNLVGFITRIYHDARSSECQKVPVTLSHFCTKNLM